MVRYRRDKNQSEIFSTLSRLGCEVEECQTIGNGFPDLLVLFPNGTLALVEVKHPDPKKRTITPAQQRFWARFPVHVVSTVEEAESLVKQLGTPDSDRKV